MSGTGIGAAVRRKEDYRFLTGNGKHLDGMHRPGQAYAYFLRSPHAHDTFTIRTRDIAIPASTEKFRRTAQAAR